MKRTAALVASLFVVLALAGCQQPMTEADKYNICLRAEIQKTPSDIPGAEQFCAQKFPEGADDSR